jgi:phosphatidyl-myo-inositol alpha-mannosyltransferase
VRVALVCPYSLALPGGVQGQVLGLARALRVLGVATRVIGPCDGPPPDAGVTPVGNSVPFAANGSVAPVAPDLPAMRRTLAVLADEGPDVVHLHEPLVPGPTLAALLGTRLPAVGTFHASGRVPAYKWARPIMRAWAGRLAARTAVSQDAQRLAERALGGACQVLPNGVDVERFAKADPWPAEERAILFVGRHEPRKGLEVLLEAFASLERGVALWVVGEGPETARLRAGSPPGVQWLGRISDAELARRLRAAAAFCAPSLHGESFGVVLLEAMAAGTPVVASDIPGYRDVARAGREALLVEPADPAALGHALRQVLDTPSLASELVEGGRVRAAGFSMERLAERYLSIYETVA